MSMLSKLRNMKQDLRDVTLAIGDKTKADAAQAKARIAELQTLPTELPESWEEHIDENGKPYYVDTETGEWYRIQSKQHKRIDTNEKLDIISAEAKKEFDEPTMIKKQKSNHAKRSSTSVSKRWQCEKCTLENVGHAMQCNACLEPRPDSLDDDEDEMAMNGGPEELVEQDDASDHSGSGGGVIPSSSNNRNDRNNTKNKPNCKNEEKQNKNNLFDDFINSLENNKEEKQQILSSKQSVRKQFKFFLEEMNMEQYFKNFEENDCCDMDSISIFDDELLKDIVTKAIPRRKFLAKCKVMIGEMNEFKNQYGISSTTYKRLAKYGIVTLEILSAEIRNKSDLKYNDHQSYRIF